MHQVFSAFSTTSYLSVVCRLSFVTSLVYIGFISLVAAGQQSSGQEREENGTPEAHQNLILRQYFRAQYRDIFGNRAASTPHSWIEEYIDRQIDQFLAKVKGKLSVLKENFAEVESARQAATLNTLALGQRKKAKKRWENALKQLARQARGLRKKLSNVFIHLKDKQSTPIEIGQNSRQLGFEKETKFIQRQIEKAEKRIQDYFFTLTNVVNAADLKNQNMLSYLYFVETMCQQIGKQL